MNSTTPRCTLIDSPIYIALYHEDKVYTTQAEQLLLDGGLSYLRTVGSPAVVTVLPLPDDHHLLHSCCHPQLKQGESENVSADIQLFTDHCTPHLENGIPGNNGDIQVPPEHFHQLHHHSHRYLKQHRHDKSNRVACMASSPKLDLQPYVYSHTIRITRRAD